MSRAHTASGEYYQEEEPVAGDPFDKWDGASIRRAMTGDKRSRAKDYR
jgi:hypothetical protein